MIKIQKKFLINVYILRYRFFNSFRLYAVFLFFSTYRERPEIASVGLQNTKECSMKFRPNKMNKLQNSLQEVDQNLQNMFNLCESFVGRQNKNEHN